MLRQDWGTGHTYERAAIEEWLRRHGTSPITREVISAERLMPDPTLRKMIEDFCGEKRQLFLSWREREKAQLPSASPHARGQPATAQCDQDEDGDVVEHPYATDGIAESEPLMGASECDGPQQARSKRESLTHSQARPKKGSSSSRSSHNQNTVTSPPSGATRPSSCWVCTLF